MPFFKKRRPSPPCRPGLSHQTPRQAGRKIIIWFEILKKDETGEIVGKDYNGMGILPGWDLRDKTKKEKKTDGSFGCLRMCIYIL